MGRERGDRKGVEVKSVLAGRSVVDRSNERERDDWDVGMVLRGLRRDARTSGISRGHTGFDKKRERVPGWRRNGAGSWL